MKRIAIYTRVSTDEQTTENQLAVLSEWAARTGGQVVAVFDDNGVSGKVPLSRRKEGRALLKAAARREFDQLAVWSVDRLGRSIADLIHTLQALQSTGVDLYVHTQALDTATSAGRAMYHMLGVFAEFERDMIRDRVRAGLDRARRKGTKLGRRPTKHADEIRRRLAAGESTRSIARTLGVGVATVNRYKGES